MYGFVEEYPHNIFDTVEIELSLLFDAAARGLPFVDEKRKWLTDEGELVIWKKSIILMSRFFRSALMKSSLMVSRAALTNCRISFITVNLFI